MDHLFDMDVLPVFGTGAVVIKDAHLILPHRDFAEPTGWLHAAEQAMIRLLRVWEYGDDV
jgi:hypothetical protein